MDQRPEAITNLEILNLDTYRLHTYTPLTTGVWVMSWSTNCPHCINMRVYLSFSLISELMVAVDTALGDGRPDVLGDSTPSSYSGGNSLWSWMLDLPHSGWSGLLHVPSILLNWASLTHLVGGCGQMSDILDPFSENFGRANLPWSLSSLNWDLSKANK